MSPELILFSAIYTELQKAKEEEKHMNSLKVSFERQLQNERTLKIQVCVWLPTQVWKPWKFFIHSYFSFFPADVCYVTSSVVESNAELQACVELRAKSLRCETSFRKSMPQQHWYSCCAHWIQIYLKKISVKLASRCFFFHLPGCQQAGWGDEQEGDSAGRPQRHRHRGAQEGEGEQEAAAGAEGREGEAQQHHHQIPERDDRDAGGQYTDTAIWANRQKGYRIYCHVYVVSKDLAGNHSANEKPLKLLFNINWKLKNN